MATSESEWITAAKLQIVSDNGHPVPRPPPQSALRRPLPANHIYIPRIDVDALTPVVHLPGLALAVYLAIHFEAAVKKARAIKLGNKVLGERWHVGPQGKRHGLQVLEKAGLISVEYHAGTSPVVTLLDKRPGPRAVAAADA